MLAITLTKQRIKVAKWTTHQKKMFHGGTPFLSLILFFNKFLENFPWLFCFIHFPNKKHQNIYASIVKYRPKEFLISKIVKKKKQ